MKQSGKRQKSRGKRALCSAFAAVPLFLGNGFVAAAPVGKNAARNNLPAQDPLTLTAPVRHPAPAAIFMPATITAFAATARRDARIGKPYWNAMLRRQAEGLKNPASAKKYRAFLGKFNRYAQEPLKWKVKDVNTVVRFNIAYSTKLHADPYTYWASPVETVVAKKGDCKAFAVLQYAILRHLGVPENRLAIAFVNADGKRTGSDHAVLLVNMASAGKPQDFVVLNDLGPTMKASQYVRPQGASTDWPKPYVFYEAMNQRGIWLTPLQEKLSFPSAPSVKRMRVKKTLAKKVPIKRTLVQKTVPRQTAAIS